VDKALTTKTTLPTRCPQVTHTPKNSGLPTSSTGSATIVLLFYLKNKNLFGFVKDRSCIKMFVKVLNKITLSDKIKPLDKVSGYFRFSVRIIPE